MKVLVTGAKGFVGGNLCAQLRNIRDGKARNYPVKVEEVFECDRDTSREEFERWCSEADFVFHLAGVNRPGDDSEYMPGNLEPAERLLEALRRHGNRCPVMLSSSVQATLQGRYKGSEYGRSKLSCERLFFDYGRSTGAKVLVYRFQNIFGKWCRPNYNSVVATFCHNAARGLPLQVNDPGVSLDLVYIDDVVDELIGALVGAEHRCEAEAGEDHAVTGGGYCHVPVCHRATVGEIAESVERFREMPGTLGVPELRPGSFEKKLYSTYLSYLPAERMSYGLKMNSDRRGSVTEFLRTEASGQISVNVCKPGITRGEHWHNSKNEKFLVVSGRGLISLRREGADERIEFEVSGDEMQVVEMIPGYVHSIRNLSETEDLVTLIWANEPFDPSRPDTYSEQV